MMVSDIISVVVVFCLLLHGAAAAFAAAIHPSIDLDADTARDVMLTLRGRALDAVVAMPSASSQGSRQGRADTLAGPKSIPNPKTLVPRTKADRGARRTAVYLRLKEWTERSQRCVRRALARHHGADAVHFWIVNAVSVRGARGSALRAVLEECAGDVARVDPMGFYRRHRSVGGGADTQLRRPAGDPAGDGLQWNIQKIGADAAWKNGVDGQGVVVATLDGGVRYTHEALVGNYRGTLAAAAAGTTESNNRQQDHLNHQFDHDYNWKDYAYKSAYPFDSDGHGTNVQGILSGSKASGVGVAPGSKWISGKIFNFAGYSSNEWTLSGVQWAMCPTPVNSEQGANCSLGADIVSCSWGEGDATTGFLKEAMASWLKAGMVPVFAVGNAGPACATVVSPADYSGVISVGATDSHDGMVAFSSRGPGANGTDGALPYDPLTPNIVAPGLEIQGPSHTDDSGYAGFSGTSQAAPHAAGAAALVLSAHPSWTPKQVAAQLFGSAVTTALEAPGSGWLECGSPARMGLDGGKGGDWPNFVGGHGRVDVSELGKNK
jgi:subtilisin family serine protease